MAGRIGRWLRGDRGQGLVEYAVIILLMAIAVIAGLTVFGGSVANTYANIQAKLVAAGF